MQAAELYTRIKNPQLLEKSSVAELQQLVKDFPYFQSAHLLLSIASKKWDASIYQQSLKKTAIIVSNRSHFFNLIHKLENTTIENVTVEAVRTTEKRQNAPSEVAQESKQELEILKAAELSVDQNEAAKEIQKEIKAEITEETLEKEIEKQVVTSFVESEILKTSQAHKPLLPKDDPESFSDWLSYLRKNNGQPYSPVEPSPPIEKMVKPEIQQNTEALKPDVRKLKNKAIMDRIIEKNPGLIRTKEEQKFYAADQKAKESLLENEHLVTETLARIYALQGSVNKAVRAYEILSLKYPQKSAYFASLIQKLKEN